MGEFDDFAESARKSLDAQQSAAAEKQRIESAARTALLNRQASALEADALPIMEEAKVAFERRGFRVDIKPNWTREMYQPPSILFSMFGQKKRPHENSSYEIQGPLVVIATHTGGNLVVKLGTNPHGTRTDGQFDGRSADDLREAIKRAATGLVEHLAKDGF